MYVCVGLRSEISEADLSKVLPEEVEEEVRKAAEISMGTEVLYKTTCGDNWPNFIHCVCMYIFCSNVKHRISDTIITLHYYCVATRHPCSLFKLQSELHECIFISTPWHRKRRCIVSESPAYSTVLYIVKMV